jgi:exodeoxyribonuclease VII small subunit
MNEKLTYESAYDELKQISFDIENEITSIDELSLKVARASHLISYCQKRLTSTEVEVNKILDNLKG